MPLNPVNERVFRSERNGSQWIVRVREPRGRRTTTRWPSQSEEAGANCGAHVLQKGVASRLVSTSAGDLGSEWSKKTAARLGTVHLVAQFPVLDAYRKRSEARPAFQKALRDQMADYARNAPVAACDRGMSLLPGGGRD
jgi:hypothetical protein